MTKKKKKKFVLIMYKISILLICPNHYLRLLAVKQAVDAVMDHDTVKGLHKKPYTDLINFILERNMTVKKDHFLHKYYTFHTVRVGAMDSDNLVDN